MENNKELILFKDFNNFEKNTKTIATEYNNASFYKYNEMLKKIKEKVKNQQYSIHKEKKYVKKKCCEEYYIIGFNDYDGKFKGIKLAKKEKYKNKNIEFGSFDKNNNLINGIKIHNKEEVDGDIYNISCEYKNGMPDGIQIVIDKIGTKSIQYQKSKKSMQVEQYFNNGDYIIQNNRYDNCMLYKHKQEEDKTFYIGYYDKLSIDSDGAIIAGNVPIIGFQKLGDEARIALNEHIIEKTNEDLKYIKVIRFDNKVRPVFQKSINEMNNEQLKVIKDIKKTAFDKIKDIDGLFIKEHKNICDPEKFSKLTNEIINFTKQLAFTKEEQNVLNMIYKQRKQQKEMLNKNINKIKYNNLVKNNNMTKSRYNNNFYKTNVNGFYQKNTNNAGKINLPSIYQTKSKGFYK